MMALATLNIGVGAYAGDVNKDNRNLMTFVTPAGAVGRPADRRSLYSPVRQSRFRSRVWAREAAARPRSPPQLRHPRWPAIAALSRVGHRTSA